MNRVEIDAEKVYHCLHVKSRDITRGELLFYRSASVEAIRDEMRRRTRSTCTSTRVQRAIDLLLEQGLVKKSGLAFDLFDPYRTYVVYTALDTHS